MSNEFKTVDGDKLVSVTNVTRSPVGYTLTSNNVRRIIPGGATIKVKAEELRNLNLESGGSVLIKDYLRVNNRDLALEFGISEDLFDHEYSWNREDIDNVLLNGDMDVFLDALDFAPLSVIETLADRAVELEIADNNKIKALSEKIDRDISAMIRNKNLYNNTEKDEKPARKTRRVSTEPAKSVRRATTTK